MIRLFPDPCLRKVCRPVTLFDRTLGKTFDLMIKTMKSQPHGIGIAAPQIGILKPLAIVDVSARIPGAQCLKMVNPVILECSEERLSREGCMSLPDYTAYIKRYDRVVVRWQDELGDFHQKESTGIEAVCIQHEVDHLAGGLFIDRVVSLKRDMIPRSFQKPAK